MKAINTDPYLINGQHRITVNVVGCGGTGSILITKLARLNEALIHLEHPGLYVTAIDYDTVEEHNVGRQMFTRNDIGHFKANVLISKINMAFGYDWDCLNRKFKHGDHRCNILISCVDNVTARKKMMESFFEKSNSFDTTKRFYYVDCGNARNFGQVIITDKDRKLKSIEDIAPNWNKQNTKKLQGEGCNYLDRLNEQDLFINDWASMYAITIIKDLLFEKRLNYQGFFFNTNRYETGKLMIK